MAKHPRSACVMTVLIGLLPCMFSLKATSFVHGMAKVRDFPPGIDGEVYGYPDGKVGGLIVEGPFPYKNGPPVWDNGKNLLGAYGLIAAAGSFKGEDKVCTAVPVNSPFAKSKLHPVPLTNGEKLCLIGCNLTEVIKTGNNPCSIGSIDSPTHSPMACYDVGPGFAGGYGVCGYNCTVFQADGSPCAPSDIGNCSIYCDTRTFPNATIFHGQ